MKVYYALVKREFLEHRGAFLYAPAVLLSILFLATLLGAVFGDTYVKGNLPLANGSQLFKILVAGIFSAWAVYLLIALFFYFSDSFSADRRNNSLLFWKSMPQSDLTILTSKALTALTVFPLAIALYALLTGILAYVVVSIGSYRLSFLDAPGIFEALGIWLQFEIAGIAYFLLSILWFAPFLAWVAGLSTLFQRWSIPLAFLIPGVLVLLESIASLGTPGTPQPIANYLSSRIEGIDANIDIFETLLKTPDYVPISLLNDVWVDIRWFDMTTGLIFAVGMVYLASEYRRRRTAS